MPVLGVVTLSIISPSLQHIIVQLMMGVRDPDRPSSRCFLHVVAFCTFYHFQYFLSFTLTWSYILTRFFTGELFSPYLFRLVHVSSYMGPSSSAKDSQPMYGEKGNSSTQSTWSWMWKLLLALIPIFFALYAYEAIQISTCKLCSLFKPCWQDLHRRCQQHFKFFHLLKNESDIGSRPASWIDVRLMPGITIAPDWVVRTSSVEDLEVRHSARTVSGQECDWARSVNYETNMPRLTQRTGIYDVRTVNNALYLISGEGRACNRGSHRN